MTYFIINDFGEDEQADLKTFVYHIDEFADKVFDDAGHELQKSDYMKICEAYNQQGLLIAWKEK